MGAALLYNAGRRQSIRGVIVELRQKQQRRCRCSLTTKTSRRWSFGLAISTIPSRHRYHRRPTYGHWDSLLIPGACVLLSACLLPSAVQPSRAEGQWWWPFERSNKSPFDDPRLRKAKKQRARASADMQAYVDKMRAPVQELLDSVQGGQLTEKEFGERMRAIAEEVHIATQRIIYGVHDPPDARRRYEAEYGCCRPTPEALQVVSALSPLVEICAGKGHWQRALSSVGAIVVSYDNTTNPHPYSGDLAPVGFVLRGEEHALRLHRDKKLLLVYPPAGDLALRCVQEYQGDQFVYVGEGRSGMNANEEFFDKLDAEWEPTTILELDPFPQCFERLYVLRRKRVISTIAADGGGSEESQKGQRQQQKQQPTPKPEQLLTHQTHP